MDRVEVGVDDRLDDAAAWYVVADYKSSVGSVPGGGNSAAFADGIVQQLPIYGRVLPTLFAGAQIARLEYRVLSTAETKLPIKLAEFDAERASALTSDDAHAVLDEALHHIRRTVERARTGDFAVRPAPSAGCPPYCVSRDICRVPGGPRERPR
jgi:hypothetical protein